MLPINTHPQCHREFATGNIAHLYADGDIDPRIPLDCIVEAAIGDFITSGTNLAVDKATTANVDMPHGMFLAATYQKGIFQHPENARFMTHLIEQFKRGVIPTFEGAAEQFARYTELNDDILRFTGGEYALRGDSKLAMRYIIGDPTLPDLAALTSKIVETQVLYAKTPYHQVQEIVLPRIASELKRRYPNVPWSTMWDIVKEHAPDMVRHAMTQNAVIRGAHF
jgi:hypothetical protein